MAICITIISDQLYLPWDLHQLPLTTEGSDQGHSINSSWTPSAAQINPRRWIQHHNHRDVRGMHNGNLSELSCCSNKSQSIQTFLPSTPLIRRALHTSGGKAGHVSASTEFSQQNSMRVTRIHHNTWLLTLHFASSETWTDIYVIS